MIACVSRNGVIGANGKLALSYPEDMKHFRTTTKGATVIMGRKTFEEIGRPLPKRRNFVVSSTLKNVEGIEIVSTLEEAIDKSNADQDIWICGGASLYEEGMNFADTIVLTIAPDLLNEPGVEYVKFPWINPAKFTIRGLEGLEQAEADANKLMLATYTRAAVQIKFYRDPHIDQPTS